MIAGLANMQFSNFTVIINIEIKIFDIRNFTFYNPILLNPYYWFAIRGQFIQSK
jgi:hypothetical protein